MNRKHVLSISVLILLSFSVFPVTNAVALTNSQSPMVSSISGMDLNSLIGDNTPTVNNAPGTFVPQTINDRLASYKVDDLLNKWISTNTIPEALRTINGEPSIMLLVKGSDPTIGGLVDVQSYFPLGTLGYLWVHATVTDAKTLKILESNPNVVRIQSDVRMAPDFTPSRDMQGLPTPDELRSGDFDVIQPTNYKTREIIGANEIEDTYGYNGSGIVVDVHDTGVDFGHTALIGTMAYDTLGRPASFEATGIGVSITTIALKNLYESSGLDDIAAKYGALHTDANGDLDLSAFTDSDFLVFATNAGGLYALGDLGLTLPDKYHVGSIPGNQTGYAFGISMVLNGGYWTFVPFILADTNDDGNYDALYADFMTGLYMSKVFYYLLPVSSFLSDAPFDFSTADKHDNTNPYLSGDVYNSTTIGGKDGYMDISIGGLANTYDAYNFTGRLGISDPIIRGIDPSGIGFAHVWDYYGHGTGVAGNIAAQDVGYPLMNNETEYSIRGMAPGAKIIATPGLSWTAIIYGWLWSLGYEPQANLEWTFVGEHVANISSNSWGSSAFAQEFDFAQGYDLTSLMVDLLSPKGLLSPEHPGMIFVIAAGNGGPGVGTISSPANSLASIAVGASTNFWFYENYGGDETPYANYGPNQGYDEVISWSNRGPTTIGYPKVDVVHVGAYDYSVAPTNWYDGGTKAYWLFSGTSEATPMTSGSLAVILNAYKDITGKSADISVAKTLLKSTAADIGYDPYMQGAGRVDIARAVYYLTTGALPNGEELFLVNTTQSYSRGAALLNYAFSYWFGPDGIIFDTYGYNDTQSVLEQNTHSGLLTQLDDTAIYGGYITPGNAVDTDLTVQGNVDSYEAYTYKTTYTALNSTAIHTTHLFNNYSLYSIFDSTAIQNADLLQLTISYDQKYLNWLLGNHTYGPSFRIINWHDYNNDNVFETTEREMVNVVFADYNAVTVFVSTKNLGPNTMLVVEDYAYRDIGAAKWNGIDINFSVRAFTKTPDNRITITDNGSGSYTVTITVEANAIPGQYEGYVKFSGANGGYVLVPYGYSVPLVTGDYETNGWSSISGLVNTINDNGVFPAIDWGWREESGDYRFYQIKVDGNLTKANTLALEIEWDHPGTVLDVWVLDFSGRVIATSDINYISGGKFLSQPNAPPNIQRLLVDISPYHDGEPLFNGTFADGFDVFTLALHATAFAKDAAPLDPITIRAAWIGNTIDDFTTPEPILTTDLSKTLNGNPITTSFVNVTWSKVSTNPIPSFNNSKYPVTMSVSSASILQVSDVIPASELVPYSGGITPERTYELYLEEGMTAEGWLSWPNTGTDFDLLLVHKGDTISYSTDIFGGQASSLNNPEHAVATIPSTGFYLLVVEYYDGDGSDQAFNLLFTASKEVASLSAPTPQPLVFDFSSAGALDGSYLVKSQSAGWNFDTKFSTPLYFDSGAPELIGENLVLQESDISGNWSIGKFFDATPYNITVTFKGSTVYTGTNVEGFTDDIIIKASDVTGYMTNNYVYVTAVDYLGNSIINKGIPVYRLDTTKPVFTTEPDDKTVNQGQGFELTWEIKDATNGTWSITVEDSELQSGTWVPSAPYEPTPVTVQLKFDKAGEYQVTFSATDFVDRTRTSTITVVVKAVEETGGGGFLSVSTVAFLMALGALALIPITRKKNK